MRKHVASVNAALKPVIGTSIKQVGQAGGDVIFPVLTHEQAAALMKEAGILTPSGKLKKIYG
ncbi:hypothetical protein [Delftia sp. WSY_7]|uniref:hypothetical protein n=1 Tax=Delftia sp. WSY_7 TaxID=3367202 RepID=UPI003709EB12